jgi:hypothetical protein
MKRYFILSLGIGVIGTIALSAIFLMRAWNAAQEVNIVDSRTGLPEAPSPVITEAEEQRARLADLKPFQKQPEPRPKPIFVENAVVTAWCPDCTHFGESMERVGFKYSRDTMKSASVAGALPIYRIKVQTTSDFPLSASYHPVCRAVGELIRQEGKAGGCLAQRSDGPGAPSSLISQWIRDRHSRS